MTKTRRHADSIDCQILVDFIQETLIDCNLDPMGRAELFESHLNDQDHLIFSIDQMNAAWVRGVTRAAGSLIANLYESNEAVDNERVATYTRRLNELLAEKDETAYIGRDSFEHETRSADIVARWSDKLLAFVDCDGEPIGYTVRHKGQYLLREFDLYYFIDNCNNPE